MGNEPTVAPPVFADVLERDHWLWSHLDVPLLSDADLNSRLPRLPSAEDPTPPQGLPALKYCVDVADRLLEQARFGAASGYFYAACRIVAAGESRTQLDETAAPYLRALSRAAGGAGDSDASSTAIVEAALAAGSSAVRRNVISGLLSLCALGETESIYTEIVRTPRTRGEIGDRLSELFPKTRSSIEPLRGSHERLHAAALQFSSTLDELALSTKTLAASPTIAGIRNARSGLLRALAEHAEFCTSSDRSVINELQSLLATAIAAYLENEDAPSDRDIDAVTSALRAAVANHQGNGSHLASCVLTPLALALRAAFEAHFLNLVGARAARLHVVVQKQLIPRDPQSQVEIEIRNAGTSLADDVVFTVSASSPMVRFGVDLSDQDNLYFGRIGPSSVQMRPISVSWPSAEDAVEIRGRVAYRDRGLRYEQVHSLKLARQRDLDWDKLAGAPNPYPIQSITDASRLKGREGLLQVLLQGFLGRNSFLITGQRRVGKTSLVKVFLEEVRRADRPNVAVYVPIGTLGIVDERGGLGKLGRDLADQVAEQFQYQFSQSIERLIPRKSEFEESFNVAFSKFIRRFQHEHPDKRLAFALDDLDELPNALFRGPTGDAFFLALRALIDGGTTFLFVGSERLPSIISEHAERLNQVRPLPVDYLDRVAIGVLARDPTIGILDWNEDAISHVASWSAGNPYFASTLCARIWDSANSRRDYYVAQQDVLRAVEDLATSMDRTSFQHFWSDSAATDQSDRDAYSVRAASVMQALSSAQSGAHDYVARSYVARTTPGFLSETAELQIDDLLSRKILEADRSNATTIRFRVPLFAQWLKADGLGELRDSSRVRPVRPASAPQTSVTPARNELRGDELVEASKNLVYRGESISHYALERFLQQFGDISSQRLMLKLVRAVPTYTYTMPKITAGLRELHQIVLLELLRQGALPTVVEQDIYVGRVRKPKGVFVTFADQAGKSGSAMVHRYREVNSVRADNCGDPEDVFRAVSKSDDRLAVVCVDDFVGTGNGAIAALEHRFFPELQQRVPAWSERVRLFFIAVVGYGPGIERIRDVFGSALNVFCANTLGDAARAFSEKSDIFENDQERLKAREVASKFGSKLERDWPLGFEDSQALVVLDDNVPNNTLPILRKETSFWLPLFPRG